MTAWSSEYHLLNLSTSAKNFEPFDYFLGEQGYGNFEDEDGDDEDNNYDEEDETPWRTLVLNEESESEKDFDHGEGCSAHAAQQMRDDLFMARREYIL